MKKLLLTVFTVALLALTAISCSAYENEEFYKTADLRVLKSMFSTGVNIFPIPMRTECLT